LRFVKGSLGFFWNFLRFFRRTANGVGERAFSSASRRRRRRARTTATVGEVGRVSQSLTGDASEKRGSAENFFGKIALFCGKLRFGPFKALRNLYNKE